MNRQAYYLKTFLTLYKKLTNAIFYKKSDKNSLYIISKDNSIVYNLEKNSLTQFKLLNDICVVDYPEKVTRFEINYNLLSVKYNFRLFIKTFAPLYIQSLTYIYDSANWIERECWDMYGVFFINHPDLRRILTDYGFDGFPLRKDFPLTGYIEVRYDDEKSSIVYEPLEMSQEYRLFNFNSPWEKIK
jgi:NADH/F420H2 dehydrogenase subunit C